MPVLSPYAPACASQTGTLCQRIWDTIGVGWLATNADAIIQTALRIVLIVVVAIVARIVAHRAIRRLTRVTTDGRLPPLLRTLRERSEARLLGPHLVQRRRQRADTISSMLRSVVSVVIVTIAAILVLGELGINLGPILASAGIVGFAVGFGAQNLVKDFISGVFMMLEDQYGVGDRVDLGPASGTVMSVSFRVTTLRADDTGDVWYVRNGEISRVGNTSQGVQLPPITAEDVAGEGAETGTEESSAPSDVRDIHISGDVHIAGGLHLGADAAVSPVPPHGDDGTAQDPSDTIDP